MTIATVLPSSFLRAGVVAGLSLLGACTGGERNRTGECPADETCSELTPDGLHFVGAVLHDFVADTAPWATAVGGVQVVGVFVEDGSSVDLDPLGLAYDARVDDGNALAIVTTSGYEVTLDGVAAGDDYLRIVEAGTDLLFDRIELEAAVVTRAEIVPRGVEARDAAAPLAFLAGDVEVAVALYDADDRRVVDQSVGALVAGVEPSRPAWDVLAFEATSSGEVEVVVTPNGTPLSTQVTLVEQIEAIAPHSDDFDPTIVAGDIGTVCFDAQAGAFVVAGLAWTFAVTGPATIAPAYARNCAQVDVTGAGTFEITATAGGVSTTLALTSIATARRAPRTPAPAPRAPGRATAGERAAAAE